MRIQNRMIGTESIQQTDSTGAEAVNSQPVSTPPDSAAGKPSVLAAEAKGILDTRASLLQQSLNEALDKRTESGYQLEPTGMEFPNLNRREALQTETSGRLEYPNITFSLPEVDDQVLIKANSDSVDVENKTDRAYQHNQFDFDF